jgi:hypothetical protein
MCYRLNFAIPLFMTEVKSDLLHTHFSHVVWFVTHTTFLFCCLREKSNMVCYRLHLTVYSGLLRAQLRRFIV